MKRFINEVKVQFKRAVLVFAFTAWPVTIYEINSQELWLIHTIFATVIFWYVSLTMVKNNKVCIPPDELTDDKMQPYVPDITGMTVLLDTKTNKPIIFPDYFADEVLLLLGKRFKLISKRK